jgi:hypothetical protein
MDDLDLFDDDSEPIEAYCVKCRDKVEMEDPRPVWTRKGTPGTRGLCPMCGTTVYRMGKTDAHRHMKKPNAVRVSVADSDARTTQRRPAGAVDATYITFNDADAPFAHRLSNDLNNMGVPTYLPKATNGDVQWATDVHPALETCKQMLVLLSPETPSDTMAQESWGYFRQQKKRIVVAQLAPVEVPDDIRRANRIDFSTDYRRALRQLVQVLGE